MYTENAILNPGGLIYFQAFERVGDGGYNAILTGPKWLCLRRFVGESGERLEREGGRGALQRLR